MSQIQGGDMEQYGDWKLLKPINGKWLWECQCVNCEKILPIALRTLKSGERKTCKCRFISPNGEASFNEVLYTYKRNAMKAGRDFSLGKEDARALFKKECSYCGRPPSSLLKIGKTSTEFWYNGIDRVDNNLGYVLGNCVTCCGVCNHMKHILSEEEFLSHIRRICRYRSL